jgi:hypothetical protein
MRTATTSRTPMDGVSRACALGGRLVILFSAFLVGISPLTDYFWHFDKFPYGGEDFELSLLLIVAILGLVLVLLQHGKNGVAYLLALRRWLSLVFQGAGSPAPQSFSGLAAALHARPMPSPALSKYNLPIRI